MKFSTLAFLLTTASTAGAFAPQQTAPMDTATALFARKPFISGNWKLNPATRDEAVVLASGIASAVQDDTKDVALFVPYPYIEAAQGAVGGKVQIGAEVRRETHTKHTQTDRDEAIRLPETSDSKLRFCPPILCLMETKRGSRKKRRSCREQQKQQQQQKRRRRRPSASVRRLSPHAIWNGPTNLFPT